MSVSPKIIFIGDYPHYSDTWIDLDDPSTDMMEWDDIKQIEKEGEYQINEGITINISDVEITSADIPNCIVANNDGVTIALDINISDKLKEEGLAREFVNRIQNLRNDKGFDVVDRQLVQALKGKPDYKAALAGNVSAAAKVSVRGL